MRYRVTLRHDKANCEFVIYVDVPETAEAENQTMIRRKAVDAFQAWTTITEELRDSSALKVIRVEEAPESGPGTPPGTPRRKDQLMRHFLL